MHSLADLKYGVHSKDLILNPTSFALQVTRNLSSSWYKERPEIEISGRLKSIEVTKQIFEIYI